MFLDEVARASFEAFRRTLATKPVELIRNLGGAAEARHVQVYVADPAGQRTVAGLGLSGSAAAPATGDYLMPVGINAGGNKLDAFLRRTVRWRVRLSEEGAAQATAAFTLANDGPASGLPRYIIGPYDSDFQAGQNEQIATLYVAGGYGFTRASLDGQPVRRRGAGRLRRPRPHPAGRRAWPSRPSPWATSWPVRRPPSGSATTGSATGCCFARRRRFVPTRPRSPSRHPLAGAFPSSRRRPVRRNGQPPGTGHSTASTSWYSSSTR